MKNYIVVALVVALLTLFGCSKDGLDGVYERKIRLGDTELSHKLIFSPGGTVEMTSAFGNDNISGTYTVSGDTVTVTIEGGFSSKPTDFRIEPDALVKGDGTPWNKIR
tara:strand:- start:171 stop:494 length:324 start_codon:yes stop_codon:yes gene_type:complete